MKILAPLCFVAGAVFLFLTALEVITHGWGPLDVSVLGFYFVVLPRYLLLSAAGCFAAGFVGLFSRGEFIKRS